MSKSQKFKIMKHLSNGWGMTSLDAVLNLGIMELPKRICELQEDGYTFRKEWIQRPDGVRYIRYFLEYPFEHYTVEIKFENARAYACGRR